MDYFTRTGCCQIWIFLASLKTTNGAIFDFLATVPETFEDLATLVTASGEAAAAASDIGGDFSDQLELIDNFGRTFAISILYNSYNLTLDLVPVGNAIGTIVIFGKTHRWDFFIIGFYAMLRYCAFR